MTLEAPAPGVICVEVKQALRWILMLVLLVLTAMAVPEFPPVLDVGWEETIPGTVAVIPDRAPLQKPAAFVEPGAQGCIVYGEEPTEPSSFQTGWWVPD